MKIFMKIKTCLTLIIIQMIQIFFDPVNKKVIGKTKNEGKGKIIGELLH